MTEFKLTDGRVIQIDVDDITQAEWEAFVSRDGSAKQEREIVRKCTKLTDSEIGALKRRSEYAPIIFAIIRAMNQPLADPNSQSVSTSA